MNPQTEWLTRGEVALRFKRSERTIRRWDRFFGDAVVHVGHSVLYDFPAVERRVRQLGRSRRELPQLNVEMELKEELPDGTEVGVPALERAAPGGLS